MLHPKRRIRPAPLAKGSQDVADLIDNYFNAYNSARLREACQTFARMIDDGHDHRRVDRGRADAGRAVVGAGAAHAGRASSTTSRRRARTSTTICTSTSTCRSTAGSPTSCPARMDVALRKDGIIRVYDVLFPADVLYKTDEWLYRVMMSPEFRQADLGLGAAPPDRQVRARDGAQDGRRRSRRCWRPPTSWTCRSGSRRPATRPSASTWRRSTRRRPNAARTWIRPPT